MPQIMIESASHENTITQYGYIVGLTFFSVLGYLTYKICKKFSNNKKSNSEPVPDLII
jgi:hypothetical protein